MKENKIHGLTGKPKPQVWKSGPDEHKHKHYPGYSQQRNQANWREEDWRLTFDEWYTFWGDDIDNRGRSNGQYKLTRINKFKPWTIDNIQKYKVRNKKNERNQN